MGFKILEISGKIFNELQTGIGQIGFKAGRGKLQPDKKIC